jgi:hypothetical protein
VIYRSDGTGRGTARVMKLPQGSGVADALPAGRLLFVVSAGPNGQRTLWASDGTPRGTAPVPGVLTCGTSGQMLDGRFFFAASDREHGCELWRVALCDHGQPCGPTTCTDADGCAPVPCTPRHDCSPAPGDLCATDRCGPDGCELRLPVCAAERVPARIRRRLAEARRLVGDACSGRTGNARLRRAARLLEGSAGLVARGRLGLSPACATALDEAIDAMRARLAASRRAA